MTGAGQAGGTTGDVGPAYVLKLIEQELAPTVRDLAATEEDVGKYCDHAGAELRRLRSNLGILHKRVAGLALALSAIRSELDAAEAEDQGGTGQSPASG